MRALIVPDQRHHAFSRPSRRAMVDGRASRLLNDAPAFTNDSLATYARWRYIRRQPKRSLVYPPW